MRRVPLDLVSRNLVISVNACNWCIASMTDLNHLIPISSILKDAIPRANGLIAFVDQQDNLNAIGNDVPLLTQDAAR